MPPPAILQSATATTVFATPATLASALAAVGVPPLTDAQAAAVAAQAAAAAETAAVSQAIGLSTGVAALLALPPAVQARIARLLHAAQAQLTSAKAADGSYYLTGYDAASRWAANALAVATAAGVSGYDRTPLSALVDAYRAEALRQFHARLAPAPQIFAAG